MKAGRWIVWLGVVGVAVGWGLWRMRDWPSEKAGLARVLEEQRQVRIRGEEAGERLAGLRGRVEQEQREFRAIAARVAGLAEGGGRCGA